jgi:phosphatidylglycerophosphatase A
MPVSESDSRSSPPRAVPTWSWMLRSPARIVAFGLGSGLLRPASGTWGTLLAWLLWALVLSRLSDAAVAIVLVLSYAYGCWCCQQVGREMGEPDSSRMVWDECVAFWLVLWLSPNSFWAQLAAFALFRFFDILKPPPIRYFDARLKHGFGVMFDDILAACYSLLAMAILVRLGVLQ